LAATELSAVVPRNSASGRPGKSRPKLGRDGVFHDEWKDGYRLSFIGGEANGSCKKCGTTRETQLFRVLKVLCFREALCQSTFLVVLCISGPLYLVAIADQKRVLLWFFGGLETLPRKSSAGAADLVPLRCYNRHDHVNRRCECAPWTFITWSRCVAFWRSQRPLSTFSHIVGHDRCSEGTCVRRDAAGSILCPTAGCCGCSCCCSTSC